ncbi:MAG: SUMF1/EgtB/PvdO family nonheme iron enzyme, partial [Pseudomonadota bacterium]|nr:SUMF1/EgtB/PvdO family nonheme iron enzyme [Pseudomonadota bacterium]
LKELGWSVILKQDASRRDISRSLADFEGRLKDAEVGLMFYAGHGIQKDGANYLVPSNAQIEMEEDLHLEGVKSKEFLEVMERAGAPLNIVILDACRDNPLPKRSRSGARGLSTPVIPKGIRGTAILYSAAPGQVAQDGPRGGHGVFTGELLKVLDRPGLKLEEVFKQTATKVAAATNGSQDPWINSSVKGDFYFREGKTKSAASVPASGGLTSEIVFWQSIANSDRAGDYQAYLSQYPSGAFAALARSRLTALKETKTANLSPPSFTVEAMDETLVALRSANVRERPTVSSSKLATLKPGSAVEVTGKTQFEGKSWYQIAMSGRSAYVFGSLLGEKATPAVGVYPSLAPGKTFRDCADCPEMVVIPSGSFMMVDLNGAGYANGKPVREVHIRYNLAVGKYEVTQDEWVAVMGWNPSRFKGGRHPVESISWNDAKAFLAKLSAKTGKKYRLLSESEWEYVAWAGSDSKYPWGNGINASKENNNNETVPVGSYGANNFGLHGTASNLHEWVEDCWHKNLRARPIDGSAWTNGGDCAWGVLRGGSRVAYPKYLRSAGRDWSNATGQLDFIGFRVARTF